MKKFTRLSFAELAQTYGWSITYADGFADGEAYRSRRQQPPAYLLWGFDEYAQGFQAGFHGHGPLAASAEMSAQARAPRSALPGADPGRLRD